MSTDDVAERDEVKNEQKRTKHRTLGNTLRQGSNGGGTVIDLDKLLSVCEV